MSNRFRITIASSLVLATGSFAHAAAIPVFGTGLTNAGTLLADSAVDPHYLLTQYPGQVGITPAATYALTGITFAYDTSGTSSRWISWAPNWIDATPGGTWVYRTTFDLSAFDASTAILTGRFFTDDTSTIILNGANTGITNFSNSIATPFTITSGFVPGINTVDFQVQNIGTFISFNPSALRVDLAGTATSLPPSGAVPEPSTALLALGALSTLLVRRTHAARKS